MAIESVQQQHQGAPEGDAVNLAAHALRARPAPAGYWNALCAAAGHALVMILRRQRLVLATVIALLPVLVPLAVAMLSGKQMAQEGGEMFVQLAEHLYIAVLAPLLALFFATMLVAEDAEAQTISYVLTRPIPRSAWILGRYWAYICVASAILCISMLMSFAACTTLATFGFDRNNIGLMLHYDAVAVLALFAYGAVTMFLGAITKRPIIVGVIVLYGWQPMAVYAKGLIDVFTVQKYTTMLLPRLAGQQANSTAAKALEEFHRQVYLQGVAKALIGLAIITVLFLGLSVLTVRLRQYASARAAGS